MTDVAQLISVDSEEDDEDEEDDPDYEPLSMEEDSIQAREMVSHPSSRKQPRRQGSYIPCRRAGDIWLASSYVWNRTVVGQTL